MLMKNKQGLVVLQKKKKIQDAKRFEKVNQTMHVVLV